MIIKISNADDRKTVAGILLEAGYTVTRIKVKDGKQARTAILVREENEEDKRDD